MWYQLINKLKKVHIEIYGLFLYIIKVYYNICSKNEKVQKASAQTSCSQKETLRSQNSNWKSQLATSNGDKMGLRKLPYVFTKDGIIVLTSILRIKNDLILEIINAFDRLKNESNSVINGDEKIVDCIYEIRGKRVILDFDLARFYECKNGTKEVNQAVKNNLEKFPERYCFQIMENEYDEFLRSKFLTSKIEDGRGGRRYLPYAFTEEGVLMLATILLNFVIIYIFL